MNFKLEIFEGPLELMLSLIAKHKLNIRDIEISTLLEQFLAYLAQMESHDIEVAGEFLESAAKLLYIKTAALLPKHEADKLKRELEGALIEYALCKITAARMREVHIGDDVYVRAPAKIDSGVISKAYTLGHHPIELIQALVSVADRKSLAQLFANAPAAADINPTATLSYVSTYSKIVRVLRALYRNERVEIAGLFEGLERSEQVATFLALLELVSHGRVLFSQDSRYVEKLKQREAIAVEA
ncbi:MAG: segregation/condensation protein A [Oscillospiraceae bacterium]|nr:segregation/condensation protein A [Oscillospiraceae bacterium]